MFPFFVPRMQIELIRRLGAQRWQPLAGGSNAMAQWVLCFGPAAQLAGGEVAAELQQRYPQAVVTSCSTGTTVCHDEVVDESVAAAAIRFEQTRVRVSTVPLAAGTGSRWCGQQLGASLAGPDLSAVVVLSEGMLVNGTELVAGLAETVGPSVTLVGGMAGDGAQFCDTRVGVGADVRAGQVVGIGLYGTQLQCRTGAYGGWDVFGPPRRITAASGNVLEALDGQSALALYERYLGEEAAGLPGTALLYPLQIWPPEQPDRAVVRTVLAVDRAAGTMTFAGDLPVGWSAQLMRGHHGNLVEGAERAAAQVVSGEHAGVAGDALALLVSCVGRRLLMGQRTPDEVEAANAALGAGVRTIGFYSHGELSPNAATGCCELHNQTMTVALLSEQPSAAGRAHADGSMALVA